MKKTVTRRSFLGGLLLLICMSGCLAQSCQARRLTQEHGAELQTVYEDFAKAVVTAYETGNTSCLYDAATGYQLEHHLETTGTKVAQNTLEDWKIKVTRVTVREYSASTAEAVVEQKAVGNTADHGERIEVWIIKFEKVDGKWKVSSMEPYFTSDRG